jgi:hypothetical protein
LQWQDVILCRSISVGDCFVNWLIWNFVYSSNPALNLGKWLSKCTNSLEVYEGLKLPTIQNICVVFPWKITQSRHPSKWWIHCLVVWQDSEDKICQMAVQICISLKKWQLSITQDMGLRRSSRKFVVHTNVFSDSWHHEGILDQAQPCSILSVYVITLCRSLPQNAVT